MKNAFLLRSSAVLAVFAFSLAGCLGDSGDASHDDDFAGVLQSAGNGLFEIPSALQSASPSVESEAFLTQAALTKANASSSPDAFAQAMEPYRLVPAYIHVAESARNSVVALVRQIASEDWPDQWEGTTDEGYLVRTVSKDSALTDERSLRFRSLSMSKEGVPVLMVSFFRNARNQFSGSFLWQSEGLDSTRVLVHFNGRNAAVAGDRMLVKVVRPLSALENADAPSVVRVAAVRKGARVAVSGVSYHPTWSEADSNGAFRGAGPKFLGVRAVADADRDVALIRVALADSLVSAPVLFRDFLLHDVTARKAAVHMRSLMLANDTLNRLVWWSLDRGRSLLAVGSEAQSYLDFLGFSTGKRPGDLTVENAFQVLQNSRTAILAGDDEDLKTLYWSITLRQPIVLKSQARIIGAGAVADGFGLAETDLDADAVESQEPAMVFDEAEMLFE